MKKILKVILAPLVFLSGAREGDEITWWNEGSCHGRGVKLIRWLNKE